MRAIKARRVRTLPADLESSLRAIGLSVGDLVVYANSSCNLRCAHCYLGNELLNRALEFDADTLVAAVAGFGSLRRITLLGGEIFAHSEVEQIMDQLPFEMAQERRVTTNLTIWNDRAIRRAVERDVRICVSLDGSSSLVHNRLRGPGRFELSLRNLKRLIGLGADIEIVFTVCAWNRDDFWGLVDLCKGIGVRRLNLHLLSAQGNAAGQEPMHLFPTQWRELVSEIEAVAQDANRTSVSPLEIRFPLRYVTRHEYQELLDHHDYHPHSAGSFYCPDGRHRVVVYSDGKLFISSEAFGTEAFIGQIEDGSFKVNEVGASELARVCEVSELGIGALNPAFAGDSKFEIALSVSFKRTIVL